MKRCKQRLLVVEQQRGERVPRVVSATAADLRAIADFVENTLPPIVHVDIRSLFVSERLSVFPCDLTGAHEDELGDLILTASEIVRLSLCFETLQLGEERLRHVNGALLSLFRSALPTARELTTDQERLRLRVQIGLIPKGLDEQLDEEKLRRVKALRPKYNGEEVERKD